MLTIIEKKGCKYGAITWFTPTETYLKNLFKKSPCLNFLSCVNKSLKWQKLNSNKDKYLN